jgi:pantetheine-phosphate adenylyltransferase
MDISKHIAIYPGTFDPLTNGHISLIKRGLNIFEKIIIAVAKDTPKKPLFSLQERVNMAKDVFKDNPNIEVAPFEGLLVDYARTHNARNILRGLRAVSDFEYEFQMALMNRKLCRDV